LGDLAGGAGRSLFRGYCRCCHVAFLIWSGGGTLPNRSSHTSLSASEPRHYSTRNAFAPAEISATSLVICAWRALLRDRPRSSTSSLALSVAFRIATICAE